MESTRRTFVKAISWRILATAITMLIAYMITGETTFALKIGGLDTIIKFAAYFGHERAWLRISYGKLNVPDYQI
jgi:uncharacterized membrane protein